MFRNASQSQQWIAPSIASPAALDRVYQSSMIVRVVASVLGRLIGGNYHELIKSQSSANFLKFQSSYQPDVSIEAYLERIRRYSRCSDGCFVMALVYIDKLIEQKDLMLSSLNVHRLLVTSVMLAAKFHDDLFYNNAYYSKLGGLSLQELNLLEIDMLNQLNFSLYISAESYAKYHKQLQNYVFYLEACNMPSPPAAVNAANFTSRETHGGVTDGMCSGFQNKEFAYAPRVPSPQETAHCGFHVRQDEFLSVPNAATNLYRHLHDENAGPLVAQHGGSERMRSVIDAERVRYACGDARVVRHFECTIGEPYLDDRVHNAFGSNSCSNKSGFTTVDGAASFGSPSFHGTRSLNTMSTNFSGRFSPESIAHTVDHQRQFSFHFEDAQMSAYDAHPQPFVPDHMKFESGAKPFATLIQRDEEWGQNVQRGFGELKNHGEIVNSCPVQPRPPTQCQFSNRFDHAQRRVAPPIEAASIPYVVRPPAEPSRAGGLDFVSCCGQDPYTSTDRMAPQMIHSSTRGDFNQARVVAADADSARYMLDHDMSDRSQLHNHNPNIMQPPCVQGRLGTALPMQYVATAPVPFANSHHASFAPIYMESTTVFPGPYYGGVHGSLARVTSGQGVCLGSG